MSEHNSLFPDLDKAHADLTPPPPPIPPQNSDRVHRPISRMINDFNRNRKKKVPQHREVELEHIGPNFTICKVTTGLGVAYSIDVINTPHGQASLYHRKSRPRSVTTLEEAIVEGEFRYKHYAAGGK